MSEAVGNAKLLRVLLAQKEPQGVVDWIDTHQGDARQTYALLIDGELSDAQFTIIAYPCLSPLIRRRPRKLRHTRDLCRHPASSSRQTFGIDYARLFASRPDQRG